MDQAGFLITFNDVHLDPADAKYAIDQKMAVARLAHGTGCNRSQAGNVKILSHALKSAEGILCMLHGGFFKRSTSENVLSQPHWDPDIFNGFYLPRIIQFPYSHSKCIRANINCCCLLYTSDHAAAS